MSDSPNDVASSNRAPSPEPTAEQAKPTIDLSSETSSHSSPAADPPAAPTPDPLAEAKAEAMKWKEQLLRTAADFDNYRKRARKEVEDAQKKGVEDLLKTLLPVFDNLERAASHAEGASDSKAIAEGVKMVLKQFVDTLGRVNVVRVPTLGTSFDPLIHEAIQQVETADHAPGTVVAEVAPGYKLADKLVRAAMVVVAKPPTATIVDPS